MVQQTAGNLNEEKHQSIKDLLIWLALIPLILGTLMLCGQLALVITPVEAGSDTRSRLSAEYQAWAYDKIPAIDIEAFLKDVEQEGTPIPTVVVGVFWEPPTPTAVKVAEVTGTPQTQPSSMPGTPTPGTITLTPTNVPTRTRTAAPTNTAFPTSTPLPTITATHVTPTATTQAAATLPPPPLPPTITSTKKPPQQPTLTPTITSTVTITPTVTVTRTSTASPTVTLTPTITLTPTNTQPPPPTPPPPPPPPPTWTPTPTVVTPAPTPTYAPVRPIANGLAAKTGDGGCLAYFGYQNDNPLEVDIPIGPSNILDDPDAISNPPQPTHFLVGPVFSAFEYTWYSALPLTWTLDGRTATVQWCNP